MPFTLFKTRHFGKSDPTPQLDKRLSAAILSFLPYNDIVSQSPQKAWYSFVSNEMPIELAHLNFQRYILPQCTALFADALPGDFRFSVLSGGQTNFSYKLDV